MKPNQYKALFKLLQDESAYVSQKAYSEITSLGVDSLEPIHQHMDEGQLWSKSIQEKMNHFISETGRQVLRQSWDQFLVLEGSTSLIFGLEILDAFPFKVRSSHFAQQIQTLAGEFVSTGRPLKPLELVDYFVGSGYYSALAPSESFDIPVQNQFAYLLKHRRGTGFALSCLLISVSEYLGIQMELCAHPDRFLVKVPSKGPGLFVDPARQGELLGVDRLRFLSYQSDQSYQALKSLDHMMSSQEAMVYILQRWNTEAYEAGDDSLGRFLYELMDALKLYQLSGRLASHAPRIYQPGEIVRHAQYGYRAVVVDWDIECEASQDWLRSHPGETLKPEPWYKLLVDDGQRISYVPQSNLTPELGADRVKHPLLQYFFETCPERGYVRNGRVWPH